MKRDSRLSVALHIVLHLADFERPVRSEDLGESMGMNPVVIRRTLGGLREADIVRAEKGHGGGWTIGRSLDTISLLDVYRALDEPVLINQHRGAENPKCLVEQAVGGALNAAFDAAENLIIERFGRLKLSTLFADFKTRFRKAHKPFKHEVRP